MKVKKTPLYDTHVALGARMVEFAGWQMPVQYSGVIEEHLAVRSACGLFDVSHMGEIEVYGKGALEFVQRITTNDAGRVVDGQCQYTLLCRPDGGVVDDTIIYRFNSERVIFCVNASNTAKAFDWINAQQRPSTVTVEDVSSAYAQIALQGPRSAEVIAGLIDVKPAKIKPFHFVMAVVAGCDAVVSRTGYTGEDGFEIYCEPDEAVTVWQALMEAGRRCGIFAVGLAARDTLRLEMGYSLYGHELGDDITPLEAGLDRYVRLDKPEFVGKDALVSQKGPNGGLKKRLIAFTLTGPGVPRQGYDITVNGAKAGAVTSGTMSPSLRIGIGMGFIDAGIKDTAGLAVVIRNRPVQAQTATLPFYNKKMAGAH
ncbi:MAG: glycine cleavage system aminomethyltransferase GcvT [Deltaproteobacteria bacterium]|nr:glycine cleavage system aminomethyltransferase GcvT [Deltaproteobacteria bacterium]